MHHGLFSVQDGFYLFRTEGPPFASLPPCILPVGVAPGRERNKKQGMETVSRDQKVSVFSFIILQYEKKSFYCQVSPPAGWLCLTVLYRKFIHHQRKMLSKFLTLKKTIILT
jgi:hypothetical protein